MMVDDSPFMVQHSLICSLMSSPPVENAPVDKRQRARQLASHARSQGLAKFKGGALALVQEISGRGLLQLPLRRNDVERILTSDHWVDVEAAATPARRRRALIIAAEKLLRMIGDATAVPAPDGVDSLVPRRGIPIQPHLLLLAIQFAVAAHSQEEPADIIHERAGQITEWLRALLDFGSVIVSSPAIDCAAFVEAFVAPWRDFTKLAKAVFGLGPQSPVTAEPQDSPNPKTDSALQNAAAVVLHVAQGSRNLVAEAPGAETWWTLWTARVEKLKPSAPVPPRRDPIEAAVSTDSDYLSTASESGHAAAASSSDARNADIARAEYKIAQARTLLLKPRTRDIDRLREASAARLHQLVNEAFWGQFVSLLQQQPPDLSIIPGVVSTILDALVNAVPRRLRSRLQRDVHDAADWSVVSRRIASADADVICDLIRLISNKVLEFGAPARAADLIQRRDDILRTISHQQQGAMTVDLATSVATGLRFLADIVRQLQEDVTAFEMTAISQELAQSAVPLQRDYATRWMPPMPTWMASRRWLREINAVAGEGLALSLAHGVMLLVQSSGKAADARWANYPIELLRFSQATIFNVANVVQLSVMRLTLQVTITLILRQRLADAAKVQAACSAVDRLALSLLTNPEAFATTNAMSFKHSIRDEINGVLVPALTVPSPSSAGYLNDAEERSIFSAIDYLLDVESAQYRVFEQKVLQFMTFVADAQLGGGPMATAPCPPALSLVEVPSRNAALDIADLCRFEAEVMTPFLPSLLA